VSIVGALSGKTTLNQELLLANANTGGKVCRVAHHRSWGSAGPRGYWAEPHPVISPSGSRILFGSDWGGGTSVDAYVVELPSFVR
jgi:Tol biopolymer transport system component